MRTHLFMNLTYIDHKASIVITITETLFLQWKLENSTIRNTVICFKIYKIILFQNDQYNTYNVFLLTYRIFSSYNAIGIFVFVQILINDDKTLFLC